MDSSLSGTDDTDGSTVLRWVAVENVGARKGASEASLRWALLVIVVVVGRGVMITTGGGEVAAGRVIALNLQWQGLNARLVTGGESLALCRKLYPSFSSSR